MAAVPADRRGVLHLGALRPAAGRRALAGDVRRPLVRHRRRRQGPVLPGARRRAGQSLRRRRLGAHRRRRRHRPRGHRARSHRVLFGESVAYFIDVLIALPTLVLALVLVGLFKGSLVTVSLAIGVSSGVVLARILRAEAASVLARDYILAAHASGTSTWRTVRRHVIPNIAPIVIVQVSLIAALAILAEAALSFLGVMSRSRPSWGQTLGELQPHVTLHPGADRVPGAVPRRRHARVQSARRRPARRHRSAAASVTRGAGAPSAGAGAMPDTALVSPLVGAAPTTTTGCGPVTALLEVEDLTVRFGDHMVVDDVSFTLERGGPAGDHRRVRLGQDTDRACRSSGWSRTSRGSADRVRFDGRQLLGRRDSELSKLRGEQIAMVFQNPQTALNPLMRVGKQIAEPLRRHRGLSKVDAADAAVEPVRTRRAPRSVADRAGLPAPAVGRAASARRHRHRPGVPPGAAHRRRADDGPRRHRASWRARAFSPNSSPSRTPPCCSSPTTSPSFRWSPTTCW